MPVLFGAAQPRSMETCRPPTSGWKFISQAQSVMHLQYLVTCTRTFNHDSSHLEPSYRDHSGISSNKTCRTHIHTQDECNDSMHQEPSLINVHWSARNRTVVKVTSLRYKVTFDAPCCTDSFIQESKASMFPVFYIPFCLCATQIDLFFPHH